MTPRAASPLPRVVAFAVVAIALPALASTARAAAVARYNDPVAAPARDPVAARIEEEARSLARSARRPELVTDPRLEWALAALAQRVPRGAPPASLINEALWLAGVVEPSPLVVAVTVRDGSDDALVERVRGELAPAIAAARYRRVGAYALRSSPTETRLLVALHESALALAPVPRALAAGGAATLDARVEPPFTAPELIVSRPDGSTGRAPLVVDHAGRGRATFRCAGRGRHQVELVAAGALGVTVLANFPVYCGVAPPTTLPPPGPDAGGAREPGPVRDTAGAEARLVALLARDRAAAGVAPLVVDPRLAAVARAHAEDMRAHDFVGHTSPTTGSASDRLRRAGVEEPAILLENVALADSPEAIERGFLDSPGHRANALSREVDRVGIGVAVRGEGDARDLFVTQLFARFAPPLDEGSAPVALRARVAELRRAAGRPPLADDPALDAVAREAAVGLAAGTLATDQAGAPAARAANGAAGAPYRLLRTLVVVSPLVTDLASSPSLLETRATHAGVAAVAGRRGDQRTLYQVVVLGVGK